jgi:methylated-DNA-[protein]-cysteine S-methyltransferase
MSQLDVIEIASPLGPLRLVADASALRELHMLHVADAPYRGEPPSHAAIEHPILRAASEQLHEYFAGTRRTFELPLAAAGTAFQQRVWQALLKIPFGVTWSYGQLAAHVGDRNASRAVGSANARNPLALVVPCHRVIGSKGELTGFGGGMRNKRWLLDHEARIAGLAPNFLF